LFAYVCILLVLRGVHLVYQEGSTYVHKSMPVNKCRFT